MTFITRRNKSFYAACSVFYYPGWSTSGTYNGRYFNIRARDYRPLSVQRRCRANIFPPYYPAHCFGAVPSVRCVLIRCVFALTFTRTRFLFPGFCVIWFGIINKWPLNWVAKLRQIMVSVQFSQQTELTPRNAHCTVYSFIGQRARGINILTIQC